MKSAPRPQDETARLAELESYGVLDTLPEADFDDLTRIAAEICGTPISLVSLIDDHRQWFKSRHGLDATETPREVAFCAHAILGDDVFVVEDAFEDDRFHDNPLVTGAPHVRFYAGAPLASPSGHRIGTLCVIDHKPRQLTDQQKAALAALSRQVVGQLELRKQIALLSRAETERDTAEASLRSATGPLQPLPAEAHDILGANRGRLIEFLVPLVVLGLLLAITFWLSDFARSSTRRTRVSTFSKEVSWVHRAIEARMRDYEELLQGCAALFAASESVTRDGWHRYIESIEIDRRYTGILGTGFATQVAPDELETFVENIRKTSDTGFSITPAGDRSNYFPIVYLEPRARNQAAVGFDIGSESNRRTAAERARDSGLTTVTGKIVLVQDDEHLAGFLLLVPVYRTGASLETVSQRREAFLGWVYIASRFRDLMSQLPNVRLDDVAFTVREGEPGSDSLLFEEGTPDEDLVARSSFRSTTNLEIYGRTWTVEVTPTSGFDDRTRDLTYITVLLSGGLISLLVGALLWAVLATRRRALALAADMTTTLRRSQRHVQSLIDNLAEAIVTIDGKGLIRSANQAAESLFGLRLSQIAGHPISMLLPDSQADDLVGLSTVPGKSRGSNRRFIEVLGSEMGTDADHFTILIMRDVTLKANAEKEKALVQSASLAVTRAPTFEVALKDLLRSLSEFGDWSFGEVWIPDLQGSSLKRGPVWFDEDPTGELERFAGASAGISFAVGQGLPGRCFARGELMIVPRLEPDDLDASRREWAANANLKAAVGIPVVTDDNEVVAVLVFFSTAVLDDSHRGIMILSATALQLGGLLQRRRFEDELASSEERYRELFEGANDLIQSVSADGRIQFVNRAWLETLGYEERDLPSLNLQDVIAPESIEHCEQLFTRACPAQDIGKVDAVFVTKSGERRIMEGNVSCSFDGGHLVSTRGIFRDVTERFAVEKLKKEFVSTVSHELRTPLTSIRGSLDLLSGGVFGTLSEGAGEVVNIAHRNCTRLIELINDILDLERLDTGQLDLQPEHVSVLSIITEATENLTSFAKQNGIRIEANPTDAHVTVDRKRLVQVLVNLLSNAIKFSEPDSRVRIETEEHDGQVTISVVDQGKGIPTEFVEKIFDRFQQVEASDSRSKGGSGLGLAISRAIVEQHGGQIGVTSEVGVGSTFWIRLAAADRARSALQ